MEFDLIVAKVAVVVALDLGPAPGEHFEKIETFSTNTFQLMKTTLIKHHFHSQQKLNRLSFILAHQNQQVQRAISLQNIITKVFLYIKPNLTYTNTIYVYI